MPIFNISKILFFSFLSALYLLMFVGSKSLFLIFLMAEAIHTKEIRIMIR